MTSLRLLEIVCSLSAQVALVVAATGYLTRRVCRTDRDRDELWAGCFIAILLVCLGDICLPHLRLLPVPATVFEPDVVSAVEQHTQAGGWLIAIWFAGAALVLGQLAVGVTRAALLIRRSATIDPSQLPAPWGQLTVTRESACATIPQRTVHFQMTDEIISPFCWQLHRPTIVLPKFVLAFSPEELSAVIRHELAHLKLRHPLWLFVQRLVESLVWFHPSVRGAVRQAGRVREFVCDADAATTPEIARSLLRSLLRLAEINCQQPKSSLASLATGDSTGILSQRADRLSRIEHVVPAPRRHLPCTLVPAGIAIAAMLLLWIPTDFAASTRSLWSPWPSWSANVLRAAGMPARDFEVDGHRLRTHDHAG